MLSNPVRIALLIALVAGSTTGCRKFVSALSANLVHFTDVSSTLELTDDVSRLVVSNRLGDVTVLGEPEATTIRVEVEVRLDEDRVATTEVGTFADHVRVTSDDGEIVIGDAHQGAADEKDWSLHMTVGLPPHLAVVVTTGVGDVEVRDIAGDLRITAGVGDIETEARGAGDITCTSGLGNVSVSAGTIDGPVTITAGKGDIALVIADSSPRHRVQLTAGKGNINATFPPGSPGTFEIESGLGSINTGPHSGITVTASKLSAEGSGTVGDGTAAYHIKAGAGSVTLH
ncbi:MAG: DUF4097 family beta strand repeat protein [Phycisphaerales bacterium]|nr:MAG: DUF4097 family beta strand repeat protein [Phycisphaerales bacterium]